MIKLDRTDKSVIGRWWWTVDRYTLGAVATVTSIGMILVMAASPAVAERIGLPSFHFVIRQMMFLIIGSSIIVIISMMPVVAIRRLSAIGFLGCIILLIAVQIFGSDVKGAKRWLFFAGFSLQPSEFIKPFFSVVIAWILAKRSMEDKFPSFRIASILLFVVALLLLLQPDFGMTIAISLVWGGQMFLAGLSLIWVIIIIISSIIGTICAYTYLPHVAQRINTFFDPATGDNYQVSKSLEAFINGGILGRGPGEGVVKAIIPDSHTDFIFAVAGEEFGLIVCIMIVILFAFIVIRGFYRIYFEKSLFVMLATSGLLIQFALQAIINMSVALGLIPNTGMTLPFISYGGSSTIAISISMGMILAFTRRRYGV